MLKKKLLENGIDENEIAFIHHANSDIQKKELFAKVREGKIRILIGSTSKMGAGTNVQTRLVASHDLDCPWRPSDLEQRAGRIIRQGNLKMFISIVMLQKGHLMLISISLLKINRSLYLKL